MEKKRTICDVEFVTRVEYLYFAALCDFLRGLVIHKQLGGALAAQPVHDKPFELLVLNRVFLQRQNSG